MRKKKILSVVMSSVIALGISSSVLATSANQDDGIFFDRTTNGIRLIGRKMSAEEIERYKEYEKRVEEAEKRQEEAKSPLKKEFKVSPELKKKLSEQDREDYEGTLSNGLKYKVHHMTIEEIEAYENGHKTYSYYWEGNVHVPKKNVAGTNGAQVGNDFIIAPDNTADFIVGSLPSAMPKINVGASAINGMWSDWVPNIGEYTRVTISPGSGYVNYPYEFRVSTSEVNSGIARFTIQTR